ncbi:MAG: isoleucine--tRNA ligase [Bacteroidetes bacterium]|nr:isoleucine--tRNA ligase [Bacteroidota bacterium]
MAGKYKEFSGLNLPAIEKEILGNWQSENAFEKSITLREGNTPFVFYEGPPSANGMPGIHHVIGRTIKDLICRFKTMKGFQVKRKGGWDTHGLPVELGVEKELGITKEDIGKKITVEDYNKKCREAVLRYKDKWDDLTRKIGYWVDLEHPYITFTNDYIESLWWLLKQLHNKGLLYEDVSIQPYSPAAGTGLSSHELNQPGCYKDVKDTTCVAMFRMASGEINKAHSFSQQLKNISVDACINSSPDEAEIFFLAWTTTPWTLPSNLGLTVGAGIDYALIKTFNPYTHLPVNVILAKALVGKYFKPENENGDFENYLSKDSPGKDGSLPWKILAECKGKDIEGISYEQLLAFEANKTDNPNAFKVLLGDFVTTEDGTGIVHTAPAFGADDFRVGKKYDIGILTMVDRQGKFIDGLGEFSNRYVKNYKDEPAYQDVNVDICVKLKKENRAFKVEKYEHSYPHCWRTDKPVLYYPLDAWFIKTTALKDRMVELNKTIRWKPKSTGEGRFGNWLENMVDWNLSRSRFWGTPLPVWRTKDGNEEICIGSVKELKEEGKKADEILGTMNERFLADENLDLHKPMVDEIVLVSDSGQPMKRVPDLVDVWFDSGAMPYAQWHFPFENIQTFSENYPADCIAEGVDQTRGWFYTLHAIAGLVKESVQDELKKNNIEASDDRYPGLAFKACISNGLVLDKNGVKMSKRLGNVIDPFKTIDDFGADATRWYLVTNASPWDNLKFDLECIKEVQRKFFGTLYNTYQFFVLYANVDGFHFNEDYLPVNKRPEIDRWVLSSLNSLIKKVNEAMDDYEPTIAGRLIEEFLDEHLSNWYVRLSRRRFWKPARQKVNSLNTDDNEFELDKISAYQTLYECLETITRLMAPISPFFSDAVFRNLNQVTKRVNASSVHHSDFPQADEAFIDEALEQRMQLAQDVSSLILSLRKKTNLKVRQPLQKALIPVTGTQMQEQLQKVEALIKAEVNIKEIEYATNENNIIRKKVKPNFKLLGAKLGSNMKTAASLIAKLSQAQINDLEKDGFIELVLGVENWKLEVNEVEIIAEDIPGWSVASKGKLTVALDITLSEELRMEGDAREFVNRVQNIRKDKGFELTDRIFVNVLDNTILKLSINTYKNYICAEILADDLIWVPEIKEGSEIEVNDNLLKVSVNKKG